MRRRTFVQTISARPTLRAVAVTQNHEPETRNRP
jgi:hypothetical protein